MFEFRESPWTTHNLSKNKLGANYSSWQLVDIECEWNHECFALFWHTKTAIQFCENPKNAAFSIWSVYFGDENVLNRNLQWIHALIRVAICWWRSSGMCEFYFWHFRFTTKEFCNKHIKIKFAGNTVVNHSHTSRSMVMRVHMMRLLMDTSCKSTIKIFRQTPHHSSVHANTAHFIIVQHLFRLYYIILKGNNFVDKLHTML